MQVTSERLYEIFLRHSHITTDSRNVGHNDLFFALKGDNFNGNAFAKAAIEMGAAFAVIDDPEIDGPQCLLVPDVLKALQGLASMHRDTFKIPVLAITGSNGKTTTKELITKVLSENFNVVATVGNLNNHIGVPLTLLRMNRETEFAVVEMGANHQGEIEQLCHIAKPTHGIVTNIGKAHLGGFGGFEGVVKAKSELYQWLKKSSGITFVNSGNALLMKLTAGQERVLYGEPGTADCCGEALEKGKFLGMMLRSDGNVFEVKTQLVGNYNFENVMAAACIGQYFGVEIQAIISALETYSPSNSRSQAIKTTHNEVILDAYNANPTSMVAALENLAKLQSMKKVVILGDMLELGNESLAEHAQILQLLEKHKFDEVILVGPDFQKVAHNKYQAFATSAEAAEWIALHPIEGCSILLKGSRGIQMEKVLNHL